MSEFIHLHCHSEYSMLDSAIRLPALCERAVSFGMEACAVTDHGNLCAAAEFQKVCREYGIRPIFGCEIYTCPDRRLRDGGAPHHLILLARTQEGWSNLSHLVSEAWISGFCGKPRADWELLSRFRDGLTCLSACLKGAVPGAILRGDMDGARERALRLASLFPGHFYLELQRTGLPRQEYVNQRLMELGESLRLPLAASNDCHYLEPGDAEAREVLLCVQTGKKLSGPGHPHSGTKSLFSKNPAEMAEAFADCPQAIANTVRIAADCRAEIPSGKHFFPAYPVPPGTTTEQEFRRIAEEGLRKRLSEKPSGPSSDENPYWKRLRHEMDVITRMGFPAYFLVVHEFVTWARDNGIPVGPGRGSAGGSLTAWAMRITDFDPLEYGLIFERFLNPGRSSLPDIDVDVCERRRGRILRHLRERYGEDCVAQIAAFSTLKMRAAVQDAGRSLGMGFQERTRLASFFPSFTHHRRIADVIRETPQLRDMAEKDENAARVLAVSLRIEGLVRQAGIHAAGVVMSGGPLADRVPVMLDRHGERVTQFDGPMVEAAGLVKFDILGLANMTIIQDTIDAVAREGRPAPDLRTLPLDDPVVYRLYSRADTDGVFQMESAGMRKYLTLLQPERFSDIVALLALYRPGPLESGMSQEFIRRRHGESPVRYPHPARGAGILRFLPDYIPEGGRAREDTSGRAPDPAARLRDEKDILGVCLSGHPLTSLKGEAARLGCLPLSAFSSLRPGAKVRLCVMISGFREIRDRQKRRMAVAGLEDQESYAHAYIFSQAYTPSVRELLREAADSDLPLFIEGRTEEDAGDEEDEEKRSAVLAEQVLPFGEACARSRRPAVIRVPRCLVTPEGLAGFREVLEKFPGTIAVCASIPGPDGDTLLRLGRIRVRPCPAFYEAITIWRKAAPEDSQAEPPLTGKKAEAAFAAAGIPASAGRNGKNFR